MTPKRSRIRAVALTAVGAALVASVLTTRWAQATTTTQADPSRAAAFATSLGDRSAGAYRDRATGTMIITVTDEAAAKAVQARGATPKMVSRGRGQLRQARTELDRSARMPGTTWVVDPRTDQVVVTVDSTVSATRLAAVEAVAARSGGAVRIERRAGRLAPRISGGDAIFGGQVRCSLGFNVQDDNGTPFFLTAGHCGNAAADWFVDGRHSQPAGSTVNSRFPGADMAIVQYVDNVAHPSEVDLFDGGRQRITGAGDAFVGEHVTRSGSTSGVHDGTVTGLDATVNYPEGTVFGLIQTDVCAEPGDSGGSLFDGTTAVGLTSGGSGDCRSGGETFFAPVTTALNAFGVSIG